MNCGQSLRGVGTEHTPKGVRNWAHVDNYIPDPAATPTAPTLAEVLQFFGDMIEALEAKSDAELSAMGLRRDDIPYYVFRDLYYI